MGFFEYKCLEIHSIDYSATNASHEVGSRERGVFFIEFALESMLKNIIFLILKIMLKMILYECKLLNLQSFWENLGFFELVLGHVTVCLLVWLDQPCFCSIWFSLFLMFIVYFLCLVISCFSGLIVFLRSSYCLVCTLPCFLCHFLSLTSLIVRGERAN